MCARLRSSGRVVGVAFAFALVLAGAGCVARRASTATCGELVLLDASASARHEGDRHPELVAIRSTARARCTKDDVTKTLARACLEARATRVEELARGVGPAHPRVRALDAALVAAGKGDRHPEMIETTVRLEACPWVEGSKAAREVKTPTTTGIAYPRGRARERSPIVRRACSSGSGSLGREPDAAA